MARPWILPAGRFWDKLVGMWITGLGTAAPAQRRSQRECWATLRAWPGLARLAPRSRALLEKVLLGSKGVEFRHLALEPLTEVFDLTPDALAARFARHAPALATEAAANALRRAGIEPKAMDAVIVSTCTGYLCPGLTSYVIERLGLRGDVLALDLVGQGCGAAVPNLQTAAALLDSGRCEQVLSVSLEVCSASFYLDDDPGVLVSACLFGDGAGAVVLSQTPATRGRRIEWLAATNRINPAQRDFLRFEQRGGMLRNILRKEVPVLAGRHAQAVLADTLARTGIARDTITTWILHPGGPNVLAALRASLGLCEPDLRWSAAVLREFGNLSSASVLFALDAALAGGAPGGHWWLTAFGAGFSCHGALLKVD